MFNVTYKCAYHSILFSQAHIGTLKLTLLNTHLESTADFTAERVNQFQKSLQEIAAVPRNRTVIFAGDLNLRDKEVRKFFFLHYQYNITSPILLKIECLENSCLCADCASFLPSPCTVTRIFEFVYRQTPFFSSFFFVFSCSLVSLALNFFFMLNCLLFLLL